MKFLNTIRNRVSAFMVFAFAFLVLASAANAQTDITAVISTVDGYLDAAIAVGIAVLLFVLGRKVVRRLI